MSVISDQGRCRLPAISIDSSIAVPSITGQKFGGRDVAVSAGFISIPSGDFTVDRAADVSQLPYTPAYPGQPPRPLGYDRQARRWLPVGPESIAPDGQSYFYTTVGSGSPELHVFNLSTHGDHVVFSGAGLSGRVTWNGDQIVATLPASPSGAAEAITIDPRTGTQHMLASPPSATEVPSDASTVYGFDASGHPVVRTGATAAGSLYEVSVYLGGGRQALIYSGTVGDAMDFNPYGAIADGSGLWLANEDNKYVWRWDPASGLRRYTLHGAGPTDGSIDTRPVGPCT